MPIIDKFKDMGTMVMGKIESGTIREGNSLLVMPNKVVITHFSLAHQKKLPHQCFNCDSCPKGGCQSVSCVC